MFCRDTIFNIGAKCTFFILCLLNLNLLNEFYCTDRFDSKKLMVQVPRKVTRFRRDFEGHIRLVVNIS